MSDFVRVYNTKGELVRVPAHYMSHPELSKNFTHEPKSTAVPVVDVDPGTAGETKKGK